jgi:hypothetical protein
MREPDFLLCVFWGMQPIPSRRVRCSQCPNLVAIDLRNHFDMLFPEMLPICPECFLRLVDPTFGGVAIGGRVLETEKISIPPRMVEYARDVVKQWKASRN